LAEDFYAVLGVSDDITDEGLRHAYRGLARRHHPDLHAGCPRAERRFKEVCAAYAVLSDRTSRAHYDRLLRRRSPGRGRGASRRPDDGQRPAAARSRDRTTDVQVTPGPGGTAALGGWAPMMWAPGLWAYSLWASTARTTTAGWWAPQR
jgi:DnaJ-class molecular chaperone